MRKNRMLFCALAACWLLRAQSEVTPHFTATDARPLVQVLNRVEDQYGYCINYEDPPYSASEILSSTAGGVVRVIPRSAPTVFAVPAPLPISRMSDRLGLVSYLVKQNMVNGNPGIFGVVQGAACTSVFPAAKLDSNNKIQEFTAVMQTRLTLAEGHSSAIDAVRVVVSLIQRQSGMTIREAVLPQPILSTQTDYRAYKDTPALNILAEIFDSVQAQANVHSGRGRFLAWQLLYDRSEDAYFLNIRTGVEGGTSAASATATGAYATAVRK